MRRLVLLIAILSIAQLASAEVLWDQSDFDPWGAGFFNSESGGPPFGITMHAVSDITVPSTHDWYVDTITTYYGALDLVWSEGIFEGYLHVFPKTGPLPIDGTDDPTASTVVPMTGYLNNDHHVVTATGLNLHLTPGEYWIGITPVAPGGMWGPEIHLGSVSAPVGHDTASYDTYGMPAPMWMNPMSGLDAAILIEGDASVATEPTSLSSIKALY